MAAGRGEFFRSVCEGLERKPAQSGPGGRQPGGVRDTPGPGRGRSGPGKKQTGGNRRRRPPDAARSSGSGTDHSGPQPRTERKRAAFPKIQTSPDKENLIERLPSEILMKILSYLDASSLLSISYVSKLFHQVAEDDVVWHKIYTSEFGSQRWRPKSDDEVLKVEPVEDRSAGHWKKLYFRTVAGQEMSKWRTELRDVSPYTGLPRQTEWILRNLSVSWELTVCDHSGQEDTLEQSRAYFFKSSVIVRWNGYHEFHRISSVQLHGVRKETASSPAVRKPGWRSLILKVDVKTQPAQPARFIGRDRMIKLLLLPPGFLIGIWRGQGRVAFIMFSLHFHRLVEKSLLGSPVCPYSEPVDLPPVDHSDPEFGLHGYTLHFVLHNTSTEIMSGHFRQLSCRTVEIRRGLMLLRVINRTNLSQHRSLSGNIKLPWKSESLEGSVENCCIITLTLLDEFQKPFWCVSSPVCITMARKTLSYDYSGKHFLMEHHSAEGKVEMKLVWLKEQEQFFLISLTVCIPLCKVNKHFSTEYRG
uniref:F-box only protein 15-like isoform X2 n=1 Tax=Scatophagus argus TaxID=75038 RepID=UPI001ED7EBDC|nr:F-box only protein 15-like isoform X2 [Scatophagus argus]